MSAFPVAGAAGAPSAASQGLEVRALVEQLHALRRQDLAARDWNHFAELVRQLCRARAVLFFCADPQPRVLGRTGGAEGWQPAQEPGFAEMVQRAAAAGHASGPSTTAAGRACLLLLVRVTGLGEGEGLLVLQLDEQQRPLANEMVLRAMLVADVSATQAQAAVAPVAAAGGPARGALADMVDLAAEVMAQADFAAAALALVNGVTVKLDVVQAALGWVDGPGVRTVAVSQLDRFDRKSQQVQQFERIFEELRLHDGALWAGGADAAVVDAAVVEDGEGAAWTGAELAQFAAERGNPWTCALPMRDARGRLCAVLLCVFGEAVHTQPAVEPLMLALDLVQPRLADQHWRAQGLLRRGRAWLHGAGARLFGPEHVWAKLTGVAVLLLLAYVCLGRWEHRVDATAQLVTDATRLVSAQFDGRIETVNVTAGDLVRQDAVLLALDVREQRQQEAELQAEIRRTEAEVAKFRAAEQLSEMEIAQARLEQAQARLARVAQTIAQAVAVAPFDGVVVEGERRDLLGAPVKKGEMLLRVAKVEGLYATLMVPERDIREIAADAKGQLLLLSHPDAAIPFQVASIIPVAQVKGQEGNHFVLTVRLLSPPEPWWRPGMTGLAKIDVGPRRIVWILTHRLLDNLRMFFWW